jgi:hypothetical protein
MVKSSDVSFDGFGGHFPVHVKEVGLSIERLSRSIDGK